MRNGRGSSAGNGGECAGRPRIRMTTIDGYPFQPEHWWRLA